MGVAMRLHRTGRQSMSKPKIKLSIPTRPFGWTDPRGMYDPRMPRLDGYWYEVVYKFRPMGYAVVKRSVVHRDVVEVLVNGLTHEAAEGFIKLLKEN